VIVEAGKYIYFLTYPPPTLIHLSHRFTRRSKPAAQKSFDCYLSHSAPPFQLLHQRNICHPVVKRLMRQTLPTVNRNHFFMKIPCIESFCLQKRHNRTLLFDNTLLKHGRHFDYWNQPLNMSMRLCYLDCHEAGGCCYLVIHIENVLRPLQLFYIHLWPIYWFQLEMSRSETG
jgi:hypothetical protein